MPVRLGFSRDPWYAYDPVTDRYTGTGWATEWAASKFIDLLKGARS